MGFYHRTRIPPLHHHTRVARLALAGFAFALVAVLALVVPGQAAPVLQAGTPGDQGTQLFQAKCAGCHTIGNGKLVGPDLKDVTQRRDEQWIKTFVTDPSKVFAANDPTAAKLLGEYNGLRMPTLGLSSAEVDALVAYLRGGSGPAVTSSSPANETAGNPEAGRQLFAGGVALSGGGPACMSCHTAQGTGSLSGGSLGPDLTHVVGRYGAAGLAAALNNIAFPTMTGPFTNRPLTTQEQADLVAYFSQTDRQQPPVADFAPGALTAATGRIVGLALTGTAALFILLAIFWPRQRLSVSERLRRKAARRV
jgi:mono/diheme cytochrome c family protein